MRTIVSHRVPEPDVEQLQAALHVEEPLQEPRVEATEFARARCA